MKYYAELEKTIEEAAKAAKAEPVQLVKKIAAMNDEIKSLMSENEKLKAELANNALGDTAGDIKEVNGVKYIATKVDGVDMNELRNLGDKLKGEIGSGVVVIVSAQGAGGKNLSVIACAPDYTSHRLTVLLPRVLMLVTLSRLLLLLLAVAVAVVLIWLRLVVRTC